MQLGQQSAAPRRVTNPPISEGWDDDENVTFLPIARLRRQYVDYLTAKALEIEEQKQSRHYYHGAQYTADEVRILRNRRQPVITYNRIGRKINGIVGIAEKQRQDPKAYPQAPGNDNGATVATTTLRYICDGNGWKEWLKPECLRQAAIEGIAGVELKLIPGDKGDPDIAVDLIFGDDFFYDPRSYKANFADARYNGIAKWMDLDEAQDLFPDKEEELTSLASNGYDLTTHADREFKWVYTNERRLRIVEHWYRHRGKWLWAFYCGDTLLDQGISPFRDHLSRPISRFVMFSAAVDHDGDRYGFVRNLKGPQDEINQRRSKALHISNSKRLIMDKGAVDDVEIARVEWARPDGVIEKNPNLNVEPDNTTPDLASQFQFLDEAKNEIEQFANMNPAALAGPGVKNLSGRAVNMLQQPGLAELGPFLISYRDWCIRVYRALWSTAQRFWTNERWLRVSKDAKLAEFLQVNQLTLDQWGRPVIVNELGALDVDIRIDEGPDTVTVMSDTFDVLSQFPPGAVPPQVLIKLAPIDSNTKDELLEMMAPKPNPAQQQIQDLQIAGAKAKVEKTQADTIRQRAAALSDVASAAHKGHMAGLESAQFIRDGFKDSAEPGGAPIGPDNEPGGTGGGQGVPLTPVPGAQPLPPHATLAAALMQRFGGGGVPSAPPAPPTPIMAALAARRAGNAGPAPSPAPAPGLP